MPFKKSEIIRAIVVHICKEIKCQNGTSVQFDHNATIIINQEGNLKETRVFGPVVQELQESNFIKIVSLAPEVL